MIRASVRWIALMALVAACAHAPSAPPFGGAVAWGTLRLVPREGVTVGKTGDGAYADRRLRDVRFVDYAHPGFAVVWAEGPAPDPGAASIAIEDGAGGPRLEPAHLALGAGGRIALRNDTAHAHTLSLPEAGLLRRLAPGESLELPAPAPGEATIYLLDAAPERARIFVAGGPFAVTDEDGRFELRGLAPGPLRLHAWHPRFPPTMRVAELTPGEVVRIDFELGVDRAGEETDAAH